jgi:hypothetical protein
MKKNIILMHFGMKNTLKSNHNHTPKQALKLHVGVLSLGWAWL